MYAIRGATTINKDCKDDVCAASCALFSEIMSRNGLRADQLISITISTTCDIESFYPAAALRENGLTNVPLFSAQEPNIKGSLPLCIRMLILVDADKPIKVGHTYLEGAACLRPDLK